MKRLIAFLSFIFALCFIVPVNCEAQQDWQYYFDLLMEVEEDEEGEDKEQLYEVLSEAAASPINLNAITQEDLEGLLCFSDEQIDAILEYVLHYGPVHTKAELMMIPYLDDARRGLLNCLTYLGEMPPKEMNELDSIKYNNAIEQYGYYYNMQQGKGDAVAFTRVPFYTRKGNIADENGEKAYAGGKLKSWLRLNYRLTPHIKIGAVASQDAGEPFFSGTNKGGFDYYSGFVQFQKVNIAKNIRLKNLVVGRYRIKSALGLILNTNLSFGKTIGLSSVSQSSTTILPHSSRSEGNYLQGVAGTVTFSKNLEATVFFSWREIDATLNSDSTAISTFLTNGYHRTANEIAKKNDASKTSMGANISYTFSRFNLGFTGIYNHYNLPLEPYTKGSGTSKLYRKFYPAGTDFWNISLNYGYKMGKLFRFEGETATGDSKHFATVNTLSMLIGKRLNLFAVQRYYPYKFYSTLGHSFTGGSSSSGGGTGGTGGGNQDENGIYVGALWNPNSRLSLSGYSDIAYFFWPKYQATGSSLSFDNLLQMSYKVATHSSLSARYRLRCRERDVKIESGSKTTTNLIYKDEQQLRLAFNSQYGALAWKVQTDFAYCHFDEDSFGGMLSANCLYSFNGFAKSSSSSLSRLSSNARAANNSHIGFGASYFHTKDYNSRVYAYEQSTPYSLSFPSFYGEGVRLYALAQIDMFQHLSIIGKLGLTHYFDKDTIGSSYQLINSPTQTDLDLMLRWKF